VSRLDGWCGVPLHRSAPKRVRAFVIEDIGAVMAGETPFVLAWGGIASSREALAERVGPRFLGGHVVHFDNPVGFTEVMRAFLRDP
jgi:hypothetical protein